MQVKVEKFKRKYTVPVIAIAVAGLIMALSNRPGSMSNGLPSIESDSQYVDALDLVTKTSETAVGKFNTGVELDQTDKETALKDAKIFDNMDIYRPDMEAGYYTAGLLYYLAGYSDLAEQRLSQALMDANLSGNLRSFDDTSKVKAVTADCHHMLSLIYFDRHDYKGAIDQADVAIETYPKREGYFYARAHAEVELKKIKEAKADLEQALKLNPYYQPAQRLLKLLAM